MAKKKDAPMALWDSVCTTDPAFTKPTTIGGHSFTSICPQYQIREATQKWGPMGQEGGWDVDVAYSERDLADGSVVVRCDVDLTYPGGKVKGIRKAGLLHSKTSKGYWRTDTEIYTKLRTDAMTKALSQVGFSADVFLGMFEERGYQDWARGQVSKPAEEAAPQKREPRQRKPKDTPPAQQPMGTGEVAAAEAVAKEKVDRIWSALTPEQQWICESMATADAPHTAVWDKIKDMRKGAE